MSLEDDSQEAELNAIEAALGSLVPARGRIDRDRVMFRAGQASVRPSPAGRRAWIAAVAGLGLVASGQAVWLARRPPVVERVVVVREPATAPAVAGLPTAEVQEPGPDSPGRPFGLGQTAHERMAGQVLRYGLDGLTGPALGSWGDPGPPSSPSLRSLREELRDALLPGDPS